MELPEDVVSIISDYSKPMTRPDWKTLHKMPLEILQSGYADILTERQYMSHEKYINRNRLFTIGRYYHMFARNSWNHKSHTSVQPGGYYIR
jgi:hypothetical protein